MQLCSYVARTHKDMIFIHLAFGLRKHYSYLHLLWVLNSSKLWRRDCLTYLLPGTSVSSSNSPAACLSVFSAIIQSIFFFKLGTWKMFLLCRLLLYAIIPCNLED